MQREETSRRSWPARQGPPESKTPLFARDRAHRVVSSFLPEGSQAPGAGLPHGLPLVRPGAGPGAVHELARSRSRDPVRSFGSDESRARRKVRAPSRGGPLPPGHITHRGRLSRSPVTARPFRARVPDSAPGSHRWVDPSGCTLQADRFRILRWVPVKPQDTDMRAIRGGQNFCKRLQ